MTTDEERDAIDDMVIVQQIRAQLPHRFKIEYRRTHGDFELTITDRKTGDDTIMWGTSYIDCEQKYVQWCKDNNFTVGVSLHG